jgi:hypothetical protein
MLVIKVNWMTQGMNMMYADMGPSRRCCLRNVWLL